MRRQPGPVFLAQHGYRRRRLADAARILPALGAVLFMVPLLGGMGHSTSGGGLWLFSCWVGLIGCAAGLSRALGRRVEEAAREAAADGAAEPPIADSDRSGAGDPAPPVLGAEVDPEPPTWPRDRG